MQGKGITLDAMAHRFHRSTLVAGILWSEQEQLAQLNRELADATEKYQDLRLRKTAVEVCLTASCRLVVCSSQFNPSQQHQQQEQLLEIDRELRRANILIDTGVLVTNTDKL